MENDILVSILCVTYNHENYIADAIEGFLSQKTNFKYEILIHDDASTDKTVQIIREYELKYPDLIKPIYQKENQYSKGVDVNKYNIDRAVGKYYALCEGDDYWTDPYKLQKQIDILEKHADYSLCVHAAIKINAATGEEIIKIKPSNENRIFATEDVIYGGGNFFATNSMVFRMDKKTVLPDFYNNCPVWDYPLTIFLSLVGKVYYIDEIMSVYRYAVPGSWTMREFSNIQNKIKHYNDISIMLDELNIYTNYKYDSIIQKTKLNRQFNLLILQRKIKEAKSDKYIEFYSKLSIGRKISLQYPHIYIIIIKTSIHLKKHCPYIHRILIRIKKVLQGANRT